MVRHPGEVTSSVPHPESGYLPGSDGYRRVLTSLFTAGMATFVLLYATQALLPEFVRDFGVSPTTSTLTMSLTTGALAVTLLIAGPVSEIVGRTQLIRLSLVGSTAIAALCPFAPTWEVLVGLRLAEGIALAGLPAVATAYLREEIAPSAQARAAGLYIGGTAIGGMAGRLITAPVADFGGWRAALAAAAGFAALCAVVVALLLPESRHFAPTPLDERGLRRQIRGALSDPALLALYAIGALALGSLVAVLTALGFRLTAEPFDLTVGAVSLIFLVYALGTVSSTVSGGLADRFGRRAVVPVGCLIGLAGVALTLVPSLPVIVLGLAVLVIGFFNVHGVASGWVAARAHAGGASPGQAAACYTFTYYVGSSVFGTLGGVAWTHAGWNGVAALSGGLLMIVSLLVLVLRRIPPLLAPGGAPLSPPG